MRLFFLMIPPPPTSTLFPYTTLFRSGLLIPVPGVATADLIDSFTQPRGDKRVHNALEDRKSTRLNSSHGYISYAVFCLKKKTLKLITSYLPIASSGPRTPTPTNHLAP